MAAFLSLPNASADQADVLILPIPYEQTVTYGAGTAGGPDAIFAASDQLEFYEEDMRWCPTEHLRLAVLDAHKQKAGELTEAFHHRLQETVANLPRNNLFIGLGGEHSITPELVFARMPQGGTVVQIDAHADLREQYQGSSYNHACPMRRLHKAGYRLIQIGIRSLHSGEAGLIAQDENISTWFDRDLRHPETSERMRQQLSSLEGPVWLTIDVDGFDPTLIGSTGTPQPGGLSWHQGLDILEALTHNRQVELCGIDILELIPDPTHISDMTAAKLVQKCISYWGKAEGFHNKPKQGSQIGVIDE